MNISIISAVFPPEPVLTAVTSSQIATQISLQGKRVKVITNFPNRPAGKIYLGYHRHIYKREVDNDGYEIIRCFTSLSTNSTLFSRLLENITFGLTSCMIVLFSQKPEVIYANTWPIFAQGLICLVARLRRIPIVLSIQDIYPELLAIQGKLSKLGVFYRILYSLDRMIAGCASAIIVISDRFAKIYTKERGIRPEKVHVIPNWVDVEEIKILPKDQCRKKYKIPENAFLLVYAGNIGVAAGVETIIQAVGSLPDYSNVILLVAGQGSQLKRSIELANKIGSEKIIFHSPWLSDETSSLLSTADILVLPTKSNQLQASVPSKLITYLFAAKPILALAKEDTDIAELIREVGWGWVFGGD